MASAEGGSVNERDYYTASTAFVASDWVGDVLDVPGVDGMNSCLRAIATFAWYGAYYSHERAAYLCEPDPNAVFGCDTATAPPVIGA
jgi:hypothetical protein